MQNFKNKKPCQTKIRAILWEHAPNLKKELAALIVHLRSDATRVEDPSGRGLFEVAAEVIIGLEKAFTDYEQKNEAAWKK